MISIRKSTLLSFEQKKRINKCSYECIYLLESILLDNGFILKLSGSTLNIYTVTLFNNILDCDCMDNTKKNIYCKHICFVICFIGQIYNEDTFNRNYLNASEIKSIIDRLHTNCDNDPNIIWEYIIDKYNNIKNTENKFCEKNKLNTQCECTICCDILHENQNLAQCPDCKNIFHNKCVEEWLKINKNCVLCRSTIWKDFKSSKYLNIS